MKGSNVKYSPYSYEIGLSIGIAGALFTATFTSMVVLSNTVVADAVIWLYDFSLIIGVAVFGGLLTLSVNLAEESLKSPFSEETFVSIGVISTVITYSVFGAGILGMYGGGYNTGLLYGLIVSLLIGCIVGFVVFATDWSFGVFELYSSVMFLAGAMFVILQYFVDPLVYIAFVLFVLGFIAEFVFRVWEMSSKRQSPVLNGFGLYIAFTGIFVHIIQWFMNDD